VARRLRRDKLEPAAHAFFAYDTGCLECLRIVVEAGAVALVDQIDPARVEYDLVRDEAAKWPGWELLPPPDPPDAYFERLAAEWEAASGVVVNSQWSADALWSARACPEKSSQSCPWRTNPEGSRRSREPPPGARSWSSGSAT